jgi:MFS family permease
MQGRKAGGVPASGVSDTIWNRNFVLLCCANFIMLLGVQLLLPTLPLYLLTIGGAQSDVGFVMAAYTIAAMFMRMVSGWLSDRYGRKRIMISGLVMMIVASLLYWIAENVPLVALTRGLHGLAFGLAGTAMGAMVADSLPTVRMAEGIGYFGLTVPLSLAVAPMIGIWLVDRFGYSILFIVVTFMAVVTLLSGLPVRGAGMRTAVRHGSIARTLSDMIEKDALLPSITMFFLSLVNGSMVYFIALYAADLRIGNAGLFFAADSLSMVVSRPLGGRWADRGSTRIVITIGLLSLLAGVVLVVLSRTMAIFLVAGALVGVGLGFSIPTLQALAVRWVSPDRRGAATGTYLVAFDMGFGVGAIIWGLVAQGLGYRVMYLTTLIPLALAAVIYFRFEERMNPRKT